MSKATKNTFLRGQNTSTDKNKTPGDQYLEAHNLELTSDGNFFGLRNIKGTTAVQTVLGSATAECLGIFPNKYKIADDYFNCLTIFTVDSVFKIWCYDAENDALYELYEESITDNYKTDDRVIDAKNYPENGIDILYYTDFYNEIRKVRCEIPSPYSANFLTSFDLSVQRRGGTGSVIYDSHITGSLLSGTYQFAYRMVDPETKTLTKWSSLSNPVHVYSAENTGTEVPYAGIGLPTPFGIQLVITPSEEEAANFDYFQLSVVENIFPVGSQQVTSGENTIFVASLLPIEATTGSSTLYEYKANTRIDLIPITDLTVDLAQIDTVKTINVHQNRLFAGNIKYKDLEFDNGDPSISSGSIAGAVASQVDSYSDQGFSSQKVGYFRNEVYRFGVVYTDKYGNKSPVRVLDLTSVTDNQISGATDMKFPDRSFDPAYYRIFATSGEIQGLGLELIALTNHPSWAVKVEIVRAKRIKNILFQTPLVPMSFVDGIGALDNYPSIATVRSGAGVADQQYPDAQPMESSRVWIPKNFFWAENRTLTKKTVAASVGAGANLRKQGETELSIQLVSPLFAIFPPSNMYGGTAFVPTGQEIIRMVDLALYRGYITDFTPSGSIAGDSVQTSISGSFYSLQDSDYYYDSATTGKTPLQFETVGPDYTTLNITEYEFFDNLSAGSSVSGNSVLKYNDLSTKGYTFGFEPTANRMAVVKTQFPINLYPFVSSSYPFLTGTYNSVVTNGFIVGSSGVRYPSAISPYASNFYVNYNTGYSNGLPIGVVPIVNVELGLGDDRYGTIHDFHEYISTGSAYTFTDAEIQDLLSGTPVPINMTVWGGDCFIGPNAYKIADSAYSNVNQNKWTGASPSAPALAADSGTIYKNIEGGAYLSMPIAVKNAGQVLQVILESEFNGGVRDKDILATTDDGNGVPIYYLQDEASIRVPLTYNYNINLSKQNDEKIYIPKPEFSFTQNIFGARTIYSDLKIYNSSEQGFDIFRVLNFTDLEESRGTITKLAIETDHLYAIQTDGMVYLPIGQTQLEQTDAGTIAVGLNTVVGRPITINSRRGSQHLRGVVETGDVIYIPDVKNKAIYVVAGPSFTDDNIISGRDNDTTFVNMFSGDIPEKNLIGVYDPVKNHYWIADNRTTTCQVFNNKLGVWAGNYEFNDPLFGGAYNNQKLYLTGRDSDNTLKVYEMYTGDTTELFGTDVVPRVKISINPDEEISKTFDNVMLASTDRLDEVDFLVERESSQGNQTITTSDLDIDQISGNYRIKVLLDSNDARARGLRMIGTFKWGTLPATLSSIVTKYRLMPKLPF